MASVVQRLNICLGLPSTLIFIKHYIYILANLLVNCDWHQVWPEDSGELDSKNWNYIFLYLASWLKEAKMGGVMYSRSKTQVYFFSCGTIRHMWDYQVQVFHGQLILKNIQSYRHCPLYFLGIKIKTFKEKPNILAKFLVTGHVLSHRGLGWPAYWLSSQPWCWHQNPVYRYCWSNFRV